MENEKFSMKFWQVGLMAKTRLAKRLNLIEDHLYELGKEAGNLTLSEIRGIYYARKALKILACDELERIERCAKTIEGMVKTEINSWNMYRQDLKKSKDELLVKAMWRL